MIISNDISKYAKAKKNEKIQEKTKKKKGEGKTGQISFNVKDITKYGSSHHPIVENVTLSFYQGAKIGIVGVNGSGKSTILRIIAGVDNDYEGQVNIQKKYKVGYFEQEPTIEEDVTVRDVVYEGIEDKLELLQELEEKKKRYEKAVQNKVPKQNLAKIKVSLDKASKKAKELGLRSIKNRAEAAMRALRCPPPDTLTNNLSGGEKRRTALCRLLVSNPDVLLLDEPTNHLDNESVSWLENFLDNYEGTVLAVTHDRYFLDNVAAYILEIDRGSAYPFKGNYSEWLLSKALRLEQEKNKEHAKSKLLKNELEWIKKSPKAKQAKNKARISRYNELVEEEKKRKYVSGRVLIPPAPRLGNTVIKVKNVSKSFDEEKILLSNVSFNIPRGSIVGIVGPNGVGKTTLFKILTGQLYPDSGEVEIGQSVKMGYVDQTRDKLDEDLTIFDEISDGSETINMGEYQMHIRQYIAGFAFKGSEQNKSINDLSGGERNRVHLAKMIRHGPNVLMLDEPTNDLDIEVLRSLEEAIAEFTGTAIVISHDRWFLDRLCTNIINFEGNGKVDFFEGSYSDYLESRSDSKSKSKTFKQINI